MFEWNDARFSEISNAIKHTFLLRKSRFDLQKWEVLDAEVTRYGCKGCYYAEAQTGTGDRLLNKGGWPKEKDPSKGGRPEKEPTDVFLRTQWSERDRKFYTTLFPVEPPQPPVGY